MLIAQGKLPAGLRFKSQLCLGLASCGLGQVTLASFHCHICSLGTSREAAFTLRLFNEQLVVLGAEGALVRSRHCWPARGPAVGISKGPGRGF